MSNGQRRDPFADVPDLPDVLLADPLGPEARKARRNLLAACLLGLLLTEGGLVPSRIAALGVDLDTSDQGALMVLFGLVVSYFLVAFVLYGSSDFLTWILRSNRALAKTLLDKAVEKAMSDVYGPVQPKTPEEDLREQVRIRAGVEVMRLLNEEGALPLGRATKPVSRVRAIFDFYFPLAVTAYTLGAILARTLR